MPTECEVVYFVLNSNTFDLEIVSAFGLLFLKNDSLYCHAVEDRTFKQIVHF
jgi:hypothetical protein